MRNRAVPIIALSVVFGAGAFARQSALPKTGVTMPALQAWAKEWIVQSTASDGTLLMHQVPAPSPAVFKAIQAMTAAEKLALTQEVLAAVKSTVMSAAFRTEHTARIAKQGNKAIDHGIDVDKYGLTGDMQADVMWTTIVPLIMQLRTFPDAAIKNAFEEDRASQAETIKEETGEERAKAQKYLAQLNALAPLMKTNPAEFKKQYTLAKSASMGGPDTEAKLQSASTGGQDKERIRLEQTFYNKYKLEAILRKNLTNFIDQATKIDLKAATRVQDSVIYWNDGTGMDGIQALEFQLGAAPTNAAVAFARAWLKELK